MLDEIGLAILRQIEAAISLRGSDGDDRSTPSGWLRSPRAGGAFILFLHLARLVDCRRGRALIAMIGLLRGRQISLVIKKVKKAG